MIMLKINVICVRFKVVILHLRRIIPTFDSKSI